ncbi:expressed hypothetical protein [Trichoplax adhaerens]|uniref:Glycerol-3-phosphate dehydrogenase [NAD(+)] n=1 Tax=Trichoplax adhaerens TaxID=10228 RepID=B3S8R2_TRIAD|nr:expressed hypothetical protein [Trichoplax adhaerens]EDV20994.1 expressed hypothetical protein [Trichoplax adhaerens]|eukprot:XP_002116638.1 expressed hypothetical protein [Trichoplax adhaerens]
MANLYKVCIVGSGNWGSAIARIVGSTVTKFDKFDNSVNMYVYEEMVDGRKLSEIINTEHENVKYLPGRKLPENIVAVPDIKEAVRNSNLLIFVVPHQFVDGICNQIKGSLRSDACGISLIKGFDCRGRGIELISSAISRLLNIEMSVLMGANIAMEVADESFCEATIGCKDRKIGTVWKELFTASYFRTSIVLDPQTVELCGALKNIIAVASGFVMGLCHSDNTRAAMIRLGLIEMIRFITEFYGEARLETYFESCGIADLITTCSMGRNQRVAEAFVSSGKTLAELEKEMLKGQYLQGPLTAMEANKFLQEKNLEKDFPIFTAVYEICYHNRPVKTIIDAMREASTHAKL